MRDLVKKSSKNLKDSPFGISEQLPIEIQKRRKEKLPLLKELRSRDIKAYFVKDKIFVGGQESVKIGTRHEGGLAIFCKTKLTDGISIDRELDCGVVVIKLKHEFFNTANDIYICFSYIPHEKSNFYNKCDVDFYDIIESVCLEFKEKGSFLVCGDLNSRIGEIDDVLSNDNLDLYLDSVDHVETPIVPKRHSVDKTVNVFGRKLLQLCYNTELTIANGRLGNRVGRFTFCTMNGRSVNDYLLNSPSDYKLIKNFDVLNFNEFSDHTPLLFELEFRNFRPDLSFPKIRNYINAHKVFGRTLLICKVRPNNEWFDNNRAIARNDFHVTRNFFLHHPSDVNRKAYVISRNNYNKMKRKAQFKYKRRKGIELCDLASTAPRKFWSSIKRKGNYKCKIDNETMMKHFESILGDSSQDLCEEVRNLIDNTVFDDIMLHN
ncbi:unnamed protein product [Mytilus coruscus]|uniref:Endonuclease/exonuclease/phosphatase domain-containing protein n=1 Tax=Mytilus coruscus TaxID=42192 RepID=A0A6J8AVH4_MYTCO|nr:unnamed protein product [Mytilus coruscus]